MKRRVSPTLVLTSAILIAVLVVTLSVAASGPRTPTVNGITTRVSVASDGAEGNRYSFEPSISADGRYLAFYSYASNLVSSDTNGTADIFVHDRATAETTRVSVASDGTEGNHWAWPGQPSISADGRYVAFGSLAGNLVSQDTNDTYDIFVHDRRTGETIRISVASDGTEGNGSSEAPSISADGRFAAFFSQASNLVPGDTNGWLDIFVHDRMTGDTTRVSVASDGTESNSNSWSPSISADGRYVAFTSFASNLVFDDTNGVRDIFVHDRVTGETTRVSVASDGADSNESSGSPSISADGSYVAFWSWANNLVPGDTNSAADVFVHDRITGKTTRVSVASDGTEADNFSQNPSVSADGRYVAFGSDASNLVPGDTNAAWEIFVHDRLTGETTRISVASNATEANDWSEHPSISADGRYVAFDSYASNLVLGDTNGERDIFVHDRAGGYNVALSANIAQVGLPGTTVSYTLPLTNTGMFTDIYDLALSGNAWPTVIDGAASVSLASGASGVVTVVVSVPAAAAIGDNDSVMLTVASQATPLVSDEAELTTTASQAHIYLPFVTQP